MLADTHPATVSNAEVWAGNIITVLVVVFLAFDAVTKIIKIPAVVRASDQLGLPPGTIVGIGVLLLACTAIYAIPQSAVFGAILLTAYLGGATAIQVRAGDGVFPVVFSVVIGVLAWVGLVLREPRLLWTILLRQ